MTVLCEKLENALQVAADTGKLPELPDDLAGHARACSSCRELVDGFRLLGEWQRAAATVVKTDRRLSDRIVAAVLQQQRRSLWRTRITGAVALAASFLLAFLLWPGRSERQLAPPAAPTASVAPAPGSAELLFPELTGANDPRPSLALSEAAEPLSNVLRSLARDLERPLRPIADATTEGLSTLFSDLPADAPAMMPGMEQMLPLPMQPPKSGSERSS